MLGTLRGPTHAILWELVRTHWTGLVSAPAAQLILVSLLFCAASNRRDGVEMLLPFIKGIMVLMVVVICSLSSLSQISFHSRALGFAYRLGFTRPVATWRLVLVPMIFLSVVTSLTCMVTIGAFNLVFGADAPLLGPAMIVFCAVCCMLAAGWVPMSLMGQVICLFATLIGFGLGVAAHHSLWEHEQIFLIAIGSRNYFQFAWYEYLVLFGLPLVTSAVTVWAVRRQRQGESGLFESREKSQRRSTRVSSDRPSTPFRSAVGAQFWFEGQRFGKQIALFCLVAPLLPLVFCLVMPLFDSGFDKAPMVWSIAIILSPVMAQIIATDGATGLALRDGDLFFSPFDATRPVRNDSLVMVKLAVVSALSILMFIWMTVFAMLHANFAGDLPLWSALGQSLVRVMGDVPWWAWPAGVCGLLMTILSGGAYLFTLAMWLPLHPRKFVAAAFIVTGHAALAIWDFNHDQTLGWLWTAYGWIFAILVLLGTIFVIQKALSRGAMGARIFLLLMILWVVYLVTSLTFAASKLSELPMVVQALTLAALVLPLGITTLAPLSYGSHRHQFGGNQK